MIEPAVLASFCAAVTVMIAIPGPNVAVILATGSVHGTRAALGVVAGTTLGQSLQLALVVLGLSTLIETWSLAFTVIKWAGIAYLAWLGFSSLMSRVSSAAPKPARGRLILRGAATALANPKTLLFHAAFLPLFIDPAYDTGPQLAVLASAFLLIAAVLDSCWAAFGGAMAQIFNGQRFKTLASRLSGTTMLLAAGWLAARRES